MLVLGFLIIDWRWQLCGVTPRQRIITPRSVQCAQQTFGLRGVGSPVAQGTEGECSEVGDEEPYKMYRGCGIH